MSANEQGGFLFCFVCLFVCLFVVVVVFVGAQTVVSLLQTTQIIPDVCFITDHVAYASSNRTRIV